jgi:LAS superfamily LD-carboxypeptidase LdcB
VGGITVNVAIADQLAGLLDAARADGIVLGGSGYRDINAQIQLRRQNCGTSDYAIWDMPPDQCSPPTARPGLSLHEQGLAVDFTANGRFITSRSDPGFVWLAANAGRFGFRNLPSEPWHWSLSGG